MISPLYTELSATLDDNYSDVSQLIEDMYLINVFVDDIASGRVDAKDLLEFVAATSIGIDQYVEATNAKLDELESLVLPGSPEWYKVL